MEYMQFREKVWNNLEKYKVDKLGIFQKYIQKYKKRNSDAYYEVRYGHILPETEWEKNLLNGVAFPQGIDAHKDAHHMNSSQIMCINFFEPLLKTAEGRKILLKWVAEVLKIDLTDGVGISEAAFEKVFDREENTNFDFYLKLSDGKNIFFEIKYTENGFGKANGKSSSYSTKWTNVYSSMVAESLYLKEIAEADFFEDYQINRNIAYIRSETDFSVFLYPFANGSLSNEMKKFSCKNMRKVDWNDALKTVLELTKGTALLEHYGEFKEKYLNFQ